MHQRPKNALDALRDLRQSRQPETSQLIPPSTKIAYTPYQVGTTETRFIQFRKGFPNPADALSTSYLSQAVYEWRSGKILSLAFRSLSLVVTLEGRALQELANALFQCKVEWIQEFDPEFHLPPSNDNSPIITSMTISRQKANPSA